MKKTLGIIISIAIGLTAYPVMNCITNALAISENPYFHSNIANTLISFAIGTFFPVIYVTITIGLSYLLKKIVKLSPLIITIFILISLFGGYFYDMYIIKGRNLKDSLIEGVVGIIWPLIVCIIGVGCSGTSISEANSNKKEPNIFDKMADNIHENNNVKYSQKASNGDTVFYNEDGQVVGRARKGNVDGQIIYEDKNGNITGDSIKTTSGLHRIYRKK